MCEIPVHIPFSVLFSFILLYFRRVAGYSRNSSLSLFVSPSTSSHRRIILRVRVANSRNNGPGEVKYKTAYRASRNVKLPAKERDGKRYDRGWRGGSSQRGRISCAEQEIASRASSSPGRTFFTSPCPSSCHPLRVRFALSSLRVAAA